VRAAAPALGGRLAVGTHLPLLGRRYRYLSLLGEGASAQARPHPGPRSHARRARARPCGAAGTRPQAPAPRRGWAAPRPGREPPGPLLTSPRQQLAYVGEATAGVTVTAGCLTLRGSWARGRPGRASQDVQGWATATADCGLPHGRPSPGAQVILAEDVLRGGGALVAIKVMHRQFAYAGQKARARVRACGRAPGSASPGRRKPRDPAAAC